VYFLLYAAAMLFRRTRPSDALHTLRSSSRGVGAAIVFDPFGDDGRRVRAKSPSFEVVKLR
jgi:hypothetical protein